MRSVSDLLSLAGAKLSPDAAPGLAPDQHGGESPASRAKATFAEVGARIGEDNEVLRNLLIDTSHQFSAIDELKETFSKLVDPLNNLLSTVEQERADIASSQGALAALRTGHDSLRAEFQELDRKSSELKTDNERLSRELETSLHNAREVEDERARIGGEVAAVRTAMALLTKQLGEETSNVRMLTEEKALLTDRADTADKRIAGLEAKIAHSRERLSLLENDKDTLQAALDRTLVESSRMSRQLAETESALAEARGSHKQMQGRLAAAETERGRLATALDESNERRQSESNAAAVKLDALRSRSEAAEKLLADARQNLVARAEEIRAAEVRLLEVAVARSEAEKKAEQLTASAETKDQQIKKLEQTGTNLTERCKVLTETLTASETALVRAKEKIKSLTANLEKHQMEAAAERAKAEERIVDLNAAIEHERSARSVAEGALEAARGDYARVQRQMSEERSTRRRDHQRRIAGNDLK